MAANSWLALDFDAAAMRFDQAAARLSLHFIQASTLQRLRAVVGQVFLYTPDFKPAEHILSKLDLVAVARLAGTYVLPDPDGQDKLVVTLRDGRPYLSGSYSVGSTYHFTIAAPVELLPEASSQFFTVTTGGTSFRFGENADGEVDHCTVISGGNQREARKPL